MAVTDTKKRRKVKQSKPRPMRERRFEPEKGRTPVVAAIVGMIGAFGLGAGVWARVFADPTPDYWFWLLVPGAALVAGAVFWGDEREAVRVGDAGVAIEKSSEIVRVPWCDMHRIHFDGGALVVEGESLMLRIPVAAHPRATAWVLAEGMKRVPDAVDVKPNAADDLPQPRDQDGESVRVEDYQVAGRSCAASDEPISFANDARLCPKCGQVYHRAHVPERCVTCEARLGGRAVRVP
jgi:hypothetical protein